MNVIHLGAEEVPVERRNVFERRHEQHMRVAAVHSSLIQTMRELCARRALSQEYDGLFDELEVLFAAEQRELAAFGELMSVRVD